MTRAVLAILAIFALGACGGADEEVTERMGRATDRAQEVRDLRGSMVLEVDAPGEQLLMEGPFEATGDGRLTHFRARFSQQGQRAFRLEMIVAGAEQYVRGGPLTKALPSGKQWFHAKDTGPQSLSFHDFLDFLRDSENMEQVGAEAVGGEETTRYKGELDLAALAERGGADVEQLLGDVDPDAIDALIDVWLDDQDLIRRMRVRFGADGEDVVDMDMLVAAYDVGARIEEPDPAAVAELPSG